jgi:hypothetical protein
MDSKKPASGAAERDLERAVLHHGAIPIADERGHVLMLGHDGTPHGYLVDAQGSDRLKARTNLSKSEQDRVDKIHHDLIDLHRDGTAPGLSTEQRQRFAERRLTLTHKLIHLLKHGG